MEYLEKAAAAGHRLATRDLARVKIRLQTQRRASSTMFSHTAPAATTSGSAYVVSGLENGREKRRWRRGRRRRE